MVRVLLRVAGDAGPEAASLHRWLLAEPAVRAQGGLAFAASDDPAHQGVVVDTLQLIVGTLLSGAQLALAVAQWRASRPAAPRVTITYRAPDGSVTSIDAADAAELDAVARSRDQQPDRDG